MLGRQGLSRLAAAPSYPRRIPLASPISVPLSLAEKAANSANPPSRRSQRRNWPGSAVVFAFPRIPQFVARVWLAGLDGNPQCFQMRFQTSLLDWPLPPTAAWAAFARTPARNYRNPPPRLSAPAAVHAARGWHAR